MHAGSVINRLDAIKKVDERISIIWEDVGAFPYHYISTKTENFDKTVETHKFKKRKNILKKQRKIV